MAVTRYMVGNSWPDLWPAKPAETMLRHSERTWWSENISSELYCWPCSTKQVAIAKTISTSMSLSKNGEATLRNRWKAQPGPPYTCQTFTWCDNGLATSTRHLPMNSGHPGRMANFAAVAGLCRVWTSQNLTPYCASASFKYHLPHLCPGKRFWLRKLRIQAAPKLRRHRRYSRNQTSARHWQVFVCALVRCVDGPKQLPSCAIQCCFQWWFHDQPNALLSKVLQLLCKFALASQAFSMGCTCPRHATSSL